MKANPVFLLAAALLTAPLTHADALADLTVKAEQGDTAAQLKLGGQYLTGQQVRKDPGAAAKWYLMAADAGNASAQCQIARMHMTGSGVAKDDVAAYKWASLSATQNDTAAKGVLIFLHQRMKPEQVALAESQARQVLEMKKPVELLPLPPPDEPEPPATPVEPAPPISE